MDFGSDKYSDSELALKVKHILAMMKGNNNFLHPLPALDALKLVNNAFLLALDRSKDGTRIEIVNKKNLRVTLENMLKQLAEYVQHESGGDETKIITSGLETDNAPTK